MLASYTTYKNRSVDRLRAELSDVACEILSMEHEDRGLLEHESNLDEAFSELILLIRRLLSDWAAPPPIKETKGGIKLPKMNVPMFNGNKLLEHLLAAI